MQKYFVENKEHKNCTLQSLSRISLHFTCLCICCCNRQKIECIRKQNKKKSIILDVMHHENAYVHYVTRLSSMFLVRSWKEFFYNMKSFLFLFLSDILSTFFLSNIALHKNCCANEDFCVICNSCHFILQRKKFAYQQCHILLIITAFLMVKNAYHQTRQKSSKKYSIVYNTSNNDDDDDYYHYSASWSRIFFGKVHKKIRQLVTKQHHRRNMSELL
jgi:hypothetical protein